jgi:hypothetical protein
MRMNVWSDRHYTGVMVIHSGFKTHMKQATPHATLIHSVFHRYTWAVKILPSNLSEVFCAAVEIVNHIEGSVGSFLAFIYYKWVR